MISGRFRGPALEVAYITCAHILLPGTQSVAGYSKLRGRPEMLVGAQEERKTPK